MIAKRLEDVKAARAADELPTNADDLQCFLPVFIGVQWGHSLDSPEGARDAERVYEKTTTG